MILSVALFAAAGCSGGMATVDPPALQIDDGPPTPPVHSVVGDLSSINADCLTIDRKTECRIEPSATGPQQSGNQATESAPPTQDSAQSEWKISVNYRVTPDRLTYGFRFIQQSGPFFYLNPRVISLPYDEESKNTYTVTMPDLSRLRVTTGSPEAFPQAAFNTILSKFSAGKPGPTSPDFTISISEDETYTFAAAGFGPLTMILQSDGSYAGPSGNLQARFRRGQWSMTVGGQGGSTIAPSGFAGSSLQTPSSTGVGMNSADSGLYLVAAVLLRLEITSARDYVVDCEMARYWDYAWYLEHCNYWDELDALAFLQDMMSWGWQPDPWTASVLIQPALRFLDDFEYDLWDYGADDYGYGEVSDAYDFVQSMIAAGAQTYPEDKFLLAAVKSDLYGYDFPLFDFGYKVGLYNPALIFDFGPKGDSYNLGRYNLRHSIFTKDILYWPGLYRYFQKPGVSTKFLRPFALPDNFDPWSTKPDVSDFGTRLPGPSRRETEFVTNPIVPDAATLAWRDPYSFRPLTGIGTSGGTQTTSALRTWDFSTRLDWGLARRYDKLDIGGNQSSRGDATWNLRHNLSLGRRYNDLNFDATPSKSDYRTTADFSNSSLFFRYNYYSNLGNLGSTATPPRQGSPGRIIHSSGYYLNSRGQLEFRHETYLEQDAPSQTMPVFPSGGPQLDFREYDTFLYAGDDWKIGRNLTLNLGLTWTYYGQPGNLFNISTTRSGTSPPQVQRPIAREKFGFERTFIGGNNSFNLRQPGSPNRGPDYLNTWSFGFERELTKSSAFAAGYVGNRAYDLYQSGANPFLSSWVGTTGGGSTSVVGGTGGGNAGTGGNTNLVASAGTGIASTGSNALGGVGTSIGVLVLSPTASVAIPAGWKKLTLDEFLNQLGLTGRPSQPPKPQPASSVPTTTSEILGPDDLVLRVDAQGRVILARGPWELATLNTTPPFGLESGTAAWMAAPLPADIPQQISYSLVANGNSAGEAFELQVMDASGQFKKVVLPDGVVLEPAAKKPPQVKAASQIASEVGNMLKQQITAFCLQFAKLPPEAGMLYKLADPDKQRQYRPLGYVLEAGYELGANGELNPDSDPKEYIDAIRQYALWAEQEGWDEQQFTDHWIERTKKNAQAMNIAWSKQMDDALRAAAPNRWRDITKVRNKAKSMMQSESSPAL